MKIAVMQYEIEALPHWQAYEDKIVRLTEQAKEKNADLLALSEYAGLELAGWSKTTKLNEQFDFIQTLLPEYSQLFSSLAAQYQLYIQAGSIPVKAPDGYFRNRAFLFSPNGKVDYQDKISLTPFEAQTRLLKTGTNLRVFETALGKLGITICYDCEFPPLTKKLTEAGAQLILVPSCTEKMTGLTRVSICAQARAIENQCYVAQSSLVGKASWCDFIDINAGQSGVYCPADMGFPEHGILAQAQLNTPMMIHADLDWNKLQTVREHGEMRNFHDMQKDISHLLNSLDTVQMIS